jgi:hypothetical protein
VQARAPARVRRAEAPENVDKEGGFIASESCFLKRLPGVGSEPGSSRFQLFSHFHHFTAEPQRLPSIGIMLLRF